MEVKGVGIGIRKTGPNRWRGLWFLCEKTTTLPERDSREDALEDASREARRVYAERLGVHLSIAQIRAAYTPIMLDDVGHPTERWSPPLKRTSKKTIFAASPLAAVLNMTTIEATQTHAGDEIATLARAAEQIDPELTNRTRMLARALDLYNEVLRRRGVFCPESTYCPVLERLFSSGLSCTVCLLLIKNQLMQEDDPTETLRDLAVIANRAFANTSDVEEGLRYYEVRRDLTLSPMSYRLLNFRFNSDGSLQAELPVQIGSTLEEVRRSLPQGLNKINPLNPEDVDVIEAWF